MLFLNLFDWMTFDKYTDMNDKNTLNKGDFEILSLILIRLTFTCCCCYHFNRVQSTVQRRISLKSLSKFSEWKKFEKWNGNEFKTCIIASCSEREVPQQSVAEANNSGLLDAEHRDTLKWMRNIDLDSFQFCVL